MGSQEARPKLRAPWDPLQHQQWLSALNPSPRASPPQCCSTFEACHLNIVLVCRRLLGVAKAHSWPAHVSALSLPSAIFLRFGIPHWRMTSALQPRAHIDSLTAVLVCTSYFLLVSGIAVLHIISLEGWMASSRRASGCLTSWARKRQREPLELEPN